LIFPAQQKNAFIIFFGRLKKSFILQYLFSFDKFEKNFDVFQNFSEKNEMGRCVWFGKKKIMEKNKKKNK